MKKLLLLVFGICIGCASADLTEKSDVINLPGMSKQQIFEKSKQWITYKFASGRAVMDYKDLTTGRIIAKGYVSLDSMMGSMMNVYLIATIDSVNGKVKLTLQPQNCQIQAARGGMECPCTGAYISPNAIEQIPIKIDSFREDFKTYMTGGKAPAWDGK